MQNYVRNLHYSNKKLICNNLKKIPLVMRLFILSSLLSIGLAHASSGYAQKAVISLEVKNQTVQEVLDEIEDKSDFTFFFNHKHLNLKRSVSISANQSNVFEILERVFEGTDVNYSVLDKKIVLSTEMKAVAQQDEKRITGTIVDAMGEPILGANIQVKASLGVGTITDMDGAFTLNTPKNAVLIVSYIGYETQEVKVAGKTQLELILREDTQALDELVVVAFGVQKKSNIIAPITSISAEDLANRPVTNMGQALQGVLPGLNLDMDAAKGGNINSELNINIRGTGTIGNGSDDAPLILIDGVAGDMNMVNPQDVESISVLKDASAASVYGSRAAFGVVLITTKSGTSGGAKVNYNASFQMSDPIILPEMMDSYTYANYINQAYSNDGKVAFFSEDQVSNIKLYQEQKLFKEGATTFDPLWTINPMSNNQYRVRDYWGNTDWLDELTKDHVFSQEHNLSVSGGKNGTNYYVSGNFLDKSGVAEFVDDTYKRYTFTAKVSTELKDWLKLESTTRFARTDFETASAATGTYKMSPYIPIVSLYDPYGNDVHYENFLSLTQGGRYRSQKDVLTQSLRVIAEPIKNWNITAEATYRSNSAFNHNEILEVYAYDGKNEPFFVKNQGKSPGYTQVKEFADKTNFFAPTITTDYKLNINDTHDLTILLGAQYEHFSGRNIEALQDGVISGDIPTLDTTNGINDAVKGGYWEWATAGVFTRASYAYKNRYLAEASVRYDGSSRFVGDQTWRWFPSASVGWIIANESFMEPTKSFLTMLKVRASLGTLGNQNTKNFYPFYVEMPLTTGTGGWLVGGEKTNTAGMPGLVSSMLTWETIQNYNYGVDFSFLDNRLSGSFDYFYRYTLDMVGPGVEKPNTLGTAVPLVNNADLLTKGFEVELSWRDKLANGFGYGARFVLSDSKTEVTQYPNETMKVDSKTFYNGMELGEIWGYDVIGLAQTQEEMDNHIASTAQNFNGGTKWQAGDLMYVDANNDGEINKGKGVLSDMGDQRVIGNTTPRYNFGLTLNADYKGFNLSMFFSGTMKRDYWTGGRALWGAAGGSLWESSSYTQSLDYFRPEGTIDPLGVNLGGYLPSPSYTAKNKQVSTKYLLDASYIKLKNVQLGYTIPSNYTKKIGVSRLNVFVSVDDLFTISKMFETIDPEMLNASGSFYPLSTIYSLGLNVTF